MLSKYQKQRVRHTSSQNIGFAKCPMTVIKCIYGIVQNHQTNDKINIKTTSKKEFEEGSKICQQSWGEIIQLQNTTMRHDELYDPRRTTLILLTKKY